MKVLREFRLLVLLLGLACMTHGTHAELSSGILRPLDIKVQEGDSLVVSGFHGSVRIVGDPTVKDLTVQVKQVNPESLPPSLLEVSDEWLFSLKRDGSQIKASVGSPVSKLAWMKYIGSEKFLPAFHLVIRSPSLPALVSWRSGPVNVEGWKESLELSTLNSNVNLSGGAGLLTVIQQEGSLTVSDHVGPLNIDTYRVNTVISKVEGSASLDSFAGSTRIEQAQGELTIHSFSGQFEVDKGKGKIDFQSDRGKMVVANHEGDLNSETDVASVKAVLVGKSRVKIKTKRGNVSLRMPNSGANVNLGTENGNLNVPNYLRFTRLPNLRLMTGRLRGKNSGRVYVRTESGEIRLR